VLTILKMKVICLFALVVVGISSAEEIKARVNLTNFAGDTPKDGGYLDLVQINGKLKITGEVKNLQPEGLHGFHVHEKGTTDDKCKASGPHYNPNNKNHGSPTDSERHVGDLGNILADKDGNAKINIIDSIALLNGDQSVLGRAVVIHAKSDDLGKGNSPDSKKTGNAGDRLLCGVIGKV